MAITKDQALNLIKNNEDKEARKFFVDWDIESLLRLFYDRKERKGVSEYKGYESTLREIDRRIESCELPDLIAPLVYEALLSREDIEYLRTL